MDASVAWAPYARDRPRTDRQPLQTPWLRLPVGGDLRRLPVHLRLRTARVAPAAQREGGLGPLDGAAARRRRADRRRDPQPAAGVAGIRSPRQLHRPARRLHQLQAAIPPRQARRPERLPELRRHEQLHRGPRVQPDVQDPGRAGRGHRRRRLPAPGDRPGDVHQLRAGAADVAQEAAVRHRPGRQELPQRDHAAELDLPHPRVRTDGDGVLRAAARSRRTGTSTGATRA